jgi:hypothetical protein
LRGVCSVLTNSTTSVLHTAQHTRIQDASQVSGGQEDLGAEGPCAHQPHMPCSAASSHVHTQEP